MKATIQVRCGNPYYRGTLHGVKFEQATGGAVGTATEAQAKLIAKESNFSVIEAEAQESESGEGAALPDLEAVNGIGPKTAAKLREAGINSLMDLADAATSLIEEVANTNTEEAEDWRKQAVELVADAASDEDEG